VSKAFILVYGLLLMRVTSWIVRIWIFDLFKLVSRPSYVIGVFLPVGQLLVEILGA
jgi:hypothetical protein